MSFWSGQTICDRRGVVSDFDEDQIDVNAYNLKMGDQYFVTSNKKDNQIVKIKGQNRVIIPAGQFAYLWSKEKLKIPLGAMAFISMSTGMKFKGLINVSGFHVDPGYEGKLIYAVYNASPADICIDKGAEIFKIWFADVDEEDKEYTYDNKDVEKNISDDQMEHMRQGKVHSLQSLAGDMDGLRNVIAEQNIIIKAMYHILQGMTITVFGGILVATVMAIVGIQ